MCGIIGLLNKEEYVSQSNEERMQLALNKIAYRGPDGSRTWKADKILLGHRRLSIIDLSDAGAQPFEISEKKLVITFNGEIYNYKELRKELSTRGYSFRSNTDTEVILLAYDCFGVDFIQHLQGMFAFCLLDRRKNIALLARDPAGEKPLYYYFDQQRFVFSSEIKLFHAFPEIPLSINAESVKAFFVLQYIPGTHSVYNEVNRLAAGSILELDLDNWTIRLQKYWSIEKSLSVRPSTLDEIDQLLAESVKYRLVADVEVGLLLSGGIDSTLLAAYANQAGANLRVFTARFEEEGLDELKYAQQVANQFGMEQIVINGGQVTPEIFDQVIFHGDDLLGDPASIPTFLLSREISQYVKVVLSGEGADELFWGYDTYRFERIWRWFSWMRPAFSHLPEFQRLVSAWEITNQVPAGLTRLGKLFSAKYDIGAARWTSVFADHTIDNLIPSQGNRGQITYLSEMEQRFAQFRQSMNYFDASTFGDLLYWLADDLLVKVDRMTMAHSVEARAPFLAPELILKSLALATKDKIKGKSGKIILRKLVEKYIPGSVGETIAWRKKHGFEVPVGGWLKGNLREVVEDRLSPKKLSHSGLLDAAFVDQLKKNFYSSSGNTPLRRKLWMILCFQTWFEQHECGFGFHNGSN